MNILYVNNYGNRECIMLWILFYLNILIDIQFHLIILVVVVMVI
jgi:hypothetical protein